MFPDGIHADGRVYPIVPGGYAVVGEQHIVTPSSLTASPLTGVVLLHARLFVFGHS